MGVGRCGWAVVGHLGKALLLRPIDLLVFDLSFAEEIGATHICTPVPIVIELFYCPNDNNESIQKITTITNSNNHGYVGSPSFQIQSLLFLYTPVSNYRSFDFSKIIVKLCI